MLSKSETSKIEKAIVEAEKNTSGEIRVHLVRKCLGDPYHEAVKIFEKLKMHETALRNGVLILLSFNDKKLAILGDKGINDKVPKDFWEEIKNEMISHFKMDKFVDGISEGILKSGEQLKKYFPYQDDDINELSNEVTFEE
tara:strand:+ start:3597 stop:4019 length:423 start_codon:yes stop_codon:yes gene_type:complete